MSKEIFILKNSTSARNHQEETIIYPLNMNKSMMLDIFFNEFGNKLTSLDGLLYLAKTQINQNCDDAIKKARNELAYLKLVLYNMRIIYQKNHISTNFTISKNLVDVLDDAVNQFNSIMFNKRLIINYFNIQRKNNLKWNFLIQIGFFNLFSFISSMKAISSDFFSNSKQVSHLQVLLKENLNLDNSYYIISITPLYFTYLEEMCSDLSNLGFIQNRSKVYTNEDIGLKLSFPLLCLSIALDIFSAFGVITTLIRQNKEELPYNNISFQLYFPK